MVAEPSQIGRYTLHGAIATGGMATVHYGRYRNDVGFARTVAIKRLLPAFAKDPGFVAMLIDEARLAARIKHPNVVQTLDVIHEGDEVLLVLEYVHGASVARIVKVLAERGERVPIPIAAAIVAGALHGVHAAHEAKDERGELLELIHRDLSPDNLLVDESGVVRVVDFGIAKARGRGQQATRPGGLKGKLSYMAPEQVHGDTSRCSDAFSMGVVLWELLVGERLFVGANDGEILAAVLTTRVARPTKRGRPDVPDELEKVVLRSLRRVPANRYATALEMALAIEQSVPLATASEVARWLSALLHDELERQRGEVAEIERGDGERARAPARATGSRGVAPSPRAGRPMRGALLALLAVLAVGCGLALAVVVFGTRRDERESAADRAAMVGVAGAVGAASVGDVAGNVAGDGASAGNVAGNVAGNGAGSAAPSAAPFSSESLAATMPSSVVEASVATSRPRGGERRPQGASPSARPRSAACDPPFTIDANGVRTWKRECF